MNTYVTSTTIKELRQNQNMTQAELADKLGVSSKTISKWECAKGLPDISLLEPLAKALGISLIELMKGDHITNKNTCGNLTRSKFYICPLCGNIIHSMGSSVISCCGITLPPLEAEEEDSDHSINIEVVEDEHFISISHPMTKKHYISFASFVTGDKVQTAKFYPEGNAETRLRLRGHGILYWYCNQHGLFKKRI